MTIDELIQLPSKHSSGLRVAKNGYENGYNDLSPEQLSLVTIAVNTSKHRWEEQHGNSNCQTGGGPNVADVVEALVLRRVSNCEKRRNW